MIQRMQRGLSHKTEPAGVSREATNAELFIFLYPNRLYAILVFERPYCCLFLRFFRKALLFSVVKLLGFGVRFRRILLE